MNNEKRAVFVVAVLGLLLVGCGKSGQEGGEQEQARAVEEEEKLTPEEQKYLDAAKPFAVAIAGRKYDEAYALLSSHATTRMSLNQFAPEDDDAKFARNESMPIAKVTAAKFAELMQTSEKRFGAPSALKDLDVFSTDPNAMDRKGKQGFDAVDAMFAVGNIPDTVPANIRRASIRGKIGTQLTPEELARIAKEYETTVEELQKDEDFEPYFTIKLVMIEDGGQLKVGYFEFLPPSMLD